MLHFGKIQACSKILDLAEKVRKFASDFMSRPSVAKKVFNIDHRHGFFFVITEGQKHKTFYNGGYNMMQYCKLMCLSMPAISI
jgi:hypothetical protein